MRGRIDRTVDTMVSVNLTRRIAKKTIKATRRHRDQTARRVWRHINGRLRFRMCHSYHLPGNVEWFQGFMMGDPP